MQEITRGPRYVTCNGCHMTTAMSEDRTVSLFTCPSCGRQAYMVHIPDVLQVVALPGGVAIQLNLN